MSDTENDNTKKNEIKKMKSVSTDKKDGIAKLPKNASTSHPSTSQMVIDALNTLEKRRQGQSLYAIKQYIASKYLIDIEQYKRFINNYLDKAVEKGEIIQIKGSYKLPPKYPVKKNVNKSTKEDDAKAEMKNGEITNENETKTVKKNKKAKSENDDTKSDKKKKATLTVKKRSSVPTKIKKTTNDKKVEKTKEKSTDKQSKKISPKKESKPSTSNKKVSKKKGENPQAG